MARGGASSCPQGLYKIPPRAQQTRRIARGSRSQPFAPAAKDISTKAITYARNERCRPRLDLCRKAAARHGSDRSDAAAHIICAGQCVRWPRQAARWGQIVRPAAMDAAKSEKLRGLSNKPLPPRGPPNGEGFCPGHKAAPIARFPADGCWVRLVGTALCPGSGHAHRKP